MLLVLLLLPNRAAPVSSNAVGLLATPPGRTPSQCLTGAWWTLLLLLLVLLPVRCLELLCSLLWQCLMQLHVLLCMHNHRRSLLLLLLLPLLRWHGWLLHYQLHLLLLVDLQLLEQALLVLHAM
jgi:hypothetical protein